METGMEEQTYSKVMYIIIGILSIIVTAFILDIATGGNIIRTLTCAIIWYMPFGKPLVGYVNCGGIPL